MGFIRLALRAFDAIHVGLTPKEEMLLTLTGELCFIGCLGRAGNKGQAVIFLEMGAETFVECAFTVYQDGGDCYSFLANACSHPEAVDQILSECADVMQRTLEAIHAKNSGFVGQ
jgi:hypothetical protein